MTSPPTRVYSFPSLSAKTVTLLSVTTFTPSLSCIVPVNLACPTWLFTASSMDCPTWSTKPAFIESAAWTSAHVSATASPKFSRKSEISKSRLLFIHSSKSGLFLTNSSHAACAEACLSFTACAFSVKSALSSISVCSARSLPSCEAVVVSCSISFLSSDNPVSLFLNSSMACSSTLLLLE